MDLEKPTKESTKTKNTKVQYDEMKKKRPHVDITTKEGNNDRTPTSKTDIMFQRGEYMTEEMTNKQTPL